MTQLRLLVACLLVCLITSIAVAEPKTIKLCYEASSSPEHKTPVAKKLILGKGLLLAVIKKAGSAANIQVLFYQRPWKRCIAEVSEGKADGMFSVIWKPERDQWGVYPKAPNNLQGPPDRRLRLWTAQYPVFTSIKGQLQWDGFRFHNIKHGVGAPLGYVAAKKLAADGVHSSLPLDPAHGFKLLTNNRLDGYVIETQYGHNIIEQLDLNDKIKTLPIHYFEADWYLVFSHQYRKNNMNDSSQLWLNLEEARTKLSKMHSSQ